MVMSALALVSAWTYLRRALGTYCLALLPCPPVSHCGMVCMVGCIHPPPPVTLQCGVRGGRCTSSLYHNPGRLRRPMWPWPVPLHGSRRNNNSSLNPVAFFLLPLRSPSGPCSLIELSRAWASHTSFTVGKGQIDSLPTAPLHSH